MTYKFENWHLIVFAAAGFLILNYGGFLGAVVDPYASYLSYDDFEDGSVDEELWDVYHATSVYYNPPDVWIPFELVSSSVLEETGGEIYVPSSKKLVVTKDFKGDDLAIVGRYKMFSCAPGSYSIPIIMLEANVGGCVFTLNSGGYTYCDAFYPATLQDTFILSVVSDELNESAAVVSLNGIEKCQLDVTDKELTFSFFNGASNGGIYLEDVFYKVPFSCTQEPGEMLAVETKAGPASVSVNTLTLPWSKFCLDHAIVRVGPGGSDTIVSPYLTMSSGGSVDIPEGQTYSFFYVFDNSENVVVTQCNLDEVYNVETEECVDLGGFVTVCSEGVWDSQLGTCAVTIGGTAVCEGDGVWNEDTQRCELTLPVSGVCPEETTLNEGVCEYVPETIEICEFGRFDLDLMKCVYNPPINEVCEKGSLNVETGECEVMIVLGTDCPSGTEWNDNLQRCEGGTTFIKSGLASEAAGVGEGESISYDEQSWLEQNILLLLLAGVVLAGLYFMFFDKKKRLSKLFKKKSRRSRR